METDRLLRQLRAPNQQGMGRIQSAENGAENVEHLATLDAEARTIQVFDSTIIPGNLQTPAYSEAVITAAHPRMKIGEVRRLVQLKDQRAKAFLRRTFDQQLRYAHYVIGERAITRCPLPSFEMHAVQLRHILMLAAHEKLVIQVLPDTKVPAGLADQFALYGLDESRHVGYVETIMGSWYSTQLKDMAKLHSAFGDIAHEAMSPMATQTFIREALSSWRSVSQASPESTKEARSSSPRTVVQEMTALESPGAPWRSEP